MKGIILALSLILLANATIKDTFSNFISRGKDTFNDIKSKIRIRDWLSIAATGIKKLSPLGPIKQITTAALVVIGLIGLAILIWTAEQIRSRMSSKKRIPRSTQEGHNVGSDSLITYT